MALLLCQHVAAYYSWRWPDGQFYSIDMLIIAVRFLHVNPFGNLSQFLRGILNPTPTLSMGAAKRITRPYRIVSKSIYRFCLLFYS